MQFTKMHGTGNDYIYINGFEQTVERPSALARRMSNRHVGVGADGLILVLPPENGAGGAHVRMRMFNADGSEAEMCGNGIRCLCKLAHDHDITPGIHEANPMRVQTAKGVLSLDYTLDESGRVDRVTVDMGKPILDPTRIPVGITDLHQIVNHPSPLPFGDWAHAAGLDQRMTCVSVGNPHAVFYVEDLDSVPLDEVGPRIEHHAAFPNRINVHFVRLQTIREVTMRTWERGSGITQACGTGAAAVCVAGALTDRSGRQICAHLPGGDLSVEWRENDHVYLTGPAAEVFTGQWPDYPPSNRSTK